ncbi:unnamed protein product [Orchesella dallaii]|uniref:Uncharacterized protein n=1 Tax=Orchesella dallaii TaxID=48710 RepID=A0ABP1Q9F3_9HEXA
MVRINDENQAPEVLKFNFEHDTRFSSLTVTRDRILHSKDTPEIEMPLNSKYLDYKSFQEPEDFHPNDLAFLSQEENRRINAMYLEEKELEKRRLIREQYPLRVIVKEGVLYSPSERVILEPFGFIQEIFQEKIDPAVIYVNYIPPPRRVVHPRDALREALYMNAQPFDENDVERYRMPLPFAPNIEAPPPPPPAPEIEEINDEYDPQPGPSRGISTPNVPTKRTYADVCKGMRQQFDDAHRPMSRGPPSEPSRAVRRLTFESHEPRPKAIKVVFEFFEEDTMGFARDKDHSQQATITPNYRSLTTAIQRHGDDKTMTTCNSVKVGHSMFGQGMVNINLFKTSNFFSGNMCPFSLREAPHVIIATVHAYYKGSMELARFHLQAEYDRAASLQEQGYTDDAGQVRKSADENYNMKMQVIMKVYENFKRNLGEPEG